MLVLQRIQTHAQLIAFTTQVVHLPTLLAAEGLCAFSLQLPLLALGLLGDQPIGLLVKLNAQLIKVFLYMINTRPL